MTHAFAAHLRASNLYPTAFTNDALIAHSLVFTARTFPIPGGTENTFTEQAVLFGLQGAVVNSFRLLDFPE